MLESVWPYFLVGWFFLLGSGAGEEQDVRGHVWLCDVCKGELEKGAGRKNSR